MAPIGKTRLHLRPGGTNDNSPAFQRWDRSHRALSPEGTVETRCLSRPFGTNPAGHAHPALKRWAILEHPSGMNQFKS